MTLFEQELLGNCEFSLIPPDGLSAVISTNPWLFLPTKSIVAYAKKQSWSAIFEWIRIFQMTFLPSLSPLLLFGHSCGTLPLSFKVGISVQSLFQFHRGRVFVLLPCMGTGRL